MAEKEASEFLKDSQKKNRDYLTSSCAECHRAQYHSSKERLFKTYSLDRKLRSAFNGARIRARKLNRNFSLELSDLYLMWNLQDGKCAITGRRMTYEHFCGRLGSNLSLDRIDSSFGYSIENSQLVCSIANTIKSDLSTKELLILCNEIIEYNSAMDREKLKARTALKNVVTGQKK